VRGQCWLAVFGQFGGLVMGKVPMLRHVDHRRDCL